MEIMLDLETMGNRSRAAIVSIGAVKFDEKGIQGEFFRNVSLESSLRHGLEIDASTVMWWMDQGDSARLKLKENPLDLAQCLMDFSAFMGTEAPIWGNGATFDNVILRHAYYACGITCPWTYASDRCYRTMKNLWPNIKMSRIGTHHNALDDARSQAMHLLEIRANLHGGES